MHSNVVCCNRLLLFLFCVDSVDIAEEVSRFEVPVSLEALCIMIHKKSRASPYPGTAMRRYPVPDDKVPWEVSLCHV